MAKKTAKIAKQVSKATSICRTVYGALASLKLSGIHQACVNRVKSALAKLENAEMRYVAYQAKQAERGTLKAARTTAKEQKSKERVKFAAVKTTKIAARIAKLQAQLKQLS